MGIKIDTSIDGDLDEYVYTHVTAEHGVTATKLESVSRLLTTPAITIGVYDLGQDTRTTGMLLVVKHDDTDGCVWGGSEPFTRVWRMVDHAIRCNGRSGREGIAAMRQLIEADSRVPRPDRMVRQEFGDLDGGTIIGMTAGSTPPPGVTVTQRFGNVTGGTIIGYDGSNQ